MNRILFNAGCAEFNSYDGRTDPNRLANLEYSLSKVIVNGSYLEFGVFNGHTINFISKLIDPKIIYGFDSWQGIPEDWFIKNSLTDPNKSVTFPRGHWKADQKPDVSNNVRLVDGWFKDSLPTFIKQTDITPIAFLHIDSDLYSSAKTIFNHLSNYIVLNTMIVFDEWHAQDHEKKAFLEWLEETDKTATAVSMTNTGQFTVLVN